MTTEIKQVLDELRDALQDMLGANLVEVRLFGSRARGDAEPDSDVDVMVLVKERSLDLEEQIIGEATEISLEHELLIIPLVWSLESREKNRELNTLIYRNIINEGIIV